MSDKHVLYTTGCPKCRIIEKKLQDKNVEYVACSDVDEMHKNGISKVPVLVLPSGEMKDYFAAVKYVNAM